MIEIGSGDGQQLRCFRELGAKVLGFESSQVLSSQSRAAGVPVITGLFTGDSAPTIPADYKAAQIVLLEHTLDHIPDPLRSLQAVGNLIDRKQGLLVIEVHDFAETFNVTEYCLIAHEHTIYPTAASLQRLLQRAGFALLEVGVLPDAVKKAHSLLVVATPLASRWAASAMPELPLGPPGDLAACRQFGNEVLATLQQLRDYFAAKRQARVRLGGYGAGGRGIMTLASTARPGDLRYVCDKSPAFHGRYLPGSHILITGPEQLMRDPVDELLVFSYGYIEEIRKDLAPFIAKGGRLTSLLDLLTGYGR